MKKENIQKKYPNIKTEEEFDKLCTMLRYKKNQRIALCSAILLLMLSSLLFVFSLTEITGLVWMICMVIAIAIVIIGEVRWGRRIDKFFLATASRKKAENRAVLSRKILQKALRIHNIGRHFADIIISELIGSFCIGIWGLIVWVLGKDDANPYPLVFFVIIPLVIFVLIKTGSSTTKGTPYVLLCTKVADRKYVNDDSETTGSYCFTFNCADYGTLDYQVNEKRYRSAIIGEDAYYLLILKHRFSDEHSIIKIFSAEEYELSPELEKIVVVL